MQLGFDFGAACDLTQMRDDLRAASADLPTLPVRTPIGQLIKSLISGRTRDADSLQAYERLIEAYPDWAAMAAAPVETIRALIAGVAYADDKAPHLTEALRRIAADYPDFDLSPLGERPIDEALTWLKRLPGVGPKVAASALNFSTLARPAFVADTHVLRVLSRFGVIGARAKAREAYDTVMAAAPQWTAAELSELHVLLKWLGQTICRKTRRACESWPIRRRCQTGRIDAAACPEP
jgi:endonuclease-3